MKLKIKKFVVFMLFLCILFALTACNKDKEEEGSEEALSYVIGSETVMAMEPDKDAELTEEEGIYTYTGMEASGESVEAYVNLMIAEEQAFLVVDEEYAEAELPDFTTAEGSVLISRPSGEEELLLIKLDWSEETCIVTPSVVEAPEEKTGFTHMEAADFVKGLHPSVLGLEGESMNEYHVYILNGLVLVNGAPCMWFEVHSSENNEQTNDPQGTYYMYRDGSRIYKLDRESSTVKELEL
ncbi:MAG: hypothetical protein IJC39_05835 [Firmicutes bacterium]|nr:hypothetical protein [Bacillota bacterium]